MARRRARKRGDKRGNPVCFIRFASGGSASGGDVRWWWGRAANPDIGQPPRRAPLSAAELTALTAFLKRARLAAEREQGGGHNPRPGYKGRPAAGS
jgi:hypothetical protein